MRFEKTTTDLAVAIVLAIAMLTAFAYLWSDY